MANDSFPYAGAAAQLRTLRDLLRFSVSRFNEAELFFGHGSASAYDEAAYLLLHSLHLPPDRLEPFLDARLTIPEREQALRMIGQRVERRIPAAYLTREAWLGDFSFYVDERVIVPRSFIAELLSDRLAPWVAHPEAVRSTLDLCTGSGCLAVLQAHAFEHAAIDAADVSHEALQVARRNVEDYGLAHRIRLVHSDLFAALRGRRYDVILSNPPYVDAAAMAALPEEYRHEPEIALSSGADGLEATRRILREAIHHLDEQGLLVVEIGHHRAALEREFPRLPFTWLETSAGDPFVFLLKRDQLA
ncbi:50S ribosomal protein L3 N(5)-glutamine methyltransferase [Nitrosovibrio sp. Nv17]|uniref:50S ribosomal protein L3 N(5)-glutamine methyltransferase n=1 Tax=Nitrosovibrio sp. Nv17 TaxID=1855339 RepID=UPI000908A5A7|nr:50S ribosomal protein L3 N(5)-glutamine methyltransferase [Nitrosovibrio sp. Nv17]SFW15613.1 [LSU ribosomal protein L3P]-glutamine N5-methyltransferase [Nitrosovibrio sp. Nv17]